jgi:hypothetical protein
MDSFLFIKKWERECSKIFTIGVLLVTFIYKISLTYYSSSLLWWWLMKSLSALIEFFSMGLWVMLVKIHIINFTIRTVFLWLFYYSSLSHSILPIHTQKIIFMMRNLIGKENKFYFTMNRRNAFSFSLRCHNLQLFSLIA